TSKRLAKDTPMARAITSLLAPGENGTTILIVFGSAACALTSAMTPNHAAAQSAIDISKRIKIRRSPVKIANPSAGDEVRHAKSSRCYLAVVRYTCNDCWIAYASFVRTDILAFCSIAQKASVA